MKKWLTAFAGLVLVACSGGNNGKTYYQLPQQAQQVALSTTQPDGRVIWVDQINVADFLAQSGIVYQTSDVQYVIANNNLWASPLEQQLRSTLLNNLRSDMPGWVISSQPIGQEQQSLSVNVTGFHGRYDGKVIVSGEWLLQRGDQIVQRPFNIQLPQQQDGYDATVKTLAAAWQQEAASIAKTVIAQP